MSGRELAFFAMDDLVRYVRVPATSANLGPGFDCLGLALGLYLDLTVCEEDGEGLEISVVGEGLGQVPLDERNVVYRGIAQAYSKVGRTPGRLKLEIHSEIPLASGLGSSSAALVAGLMVGAELCGLVPDPEQVLQQGIAIEGHPDNLAPCTLGGIVIAAMENGRVRWARVDPPSDLSAVVAIPDFSLRTHKARSVLPTQVERADAIFNMGRVGLVVAALKSGDYDLLRVGMQDRLHQVYRQSLVPGMEAVLNAALEAGALGAALSGAGPALLALVHDGEEEVATAMREIWIKEGVVARTMTLALEPKGVQRGGTWR